MYRVIIAHPPHIGLSVFDKDVSMENRRCLNGNLCAFRDRHSSFITSGGSIDHLPSTFIHVVNHKFL
jgi:hypothetical protein